MNKLAITNLLLIIWGALELAGFTCGTPKIFIGLMVLLLTVLLFGQFLKYISQEERDRREIHREKVLVLDETNKSLREEIARLKKTKASGQREKTKG